MEAIRGYYVDHHAREMGDGTGYLSNHPVTTGLVRLAEDGKTAKGMWYSIAQETRPPGGRHRPGPVDAGKDRRGLCQGGRRLENPGTS